MKVLKTYMFSNECFKNVHVLTPNRNFLERHHGLVVRALTCKGPRIKITFNWLREKHSVHPAANGYPTLFRAGECLGGKGRGDGHHLYMPCPVTHVEP